MAEQNVDCSRELHLKRRMRLSLVSKPEACKLVRKSLLTSEYLDWSGRRADEIPSLSEQEHSRTMESSNVDDRTQHELYAHPFLRSVMAGVTSVMCSYSLRISFML